jgi:hypothetical protein
MPNLKPVSEKMRKILEMLGETPQEHQAEVLARKKGVKPEPPPDNYAKNVVASWKEDPWRPDARVLFIRRSLCLQCGAQFESPHWPETFVRERRKGEPRLLNSHRYTPSRSAIMSSLALPRLVEYIDLTVYACHLCPEWHTNEQPQEQPLCLTDLLSSQLASTALSHSEGPEGSSTSQEESSTSLPLPTDEPSTEPKVDSSEASSSHFFPPAVMQPMSSLMSGFGFVRSKLESMLSPAAVKDTPSLTLEDEGIVSTLLPLSSEEI